MGLFGDVDAADIPDNPYYVAPGTYNCVLSEAKKVDKKDGSGSGLAFKWVIQDEDSEYNGSQIQDWKDIFPDLTADEITQNVRRKISFLKQRLTEMGLSPEEQNELLEPGNLEDLVGLEAYVEVVEVPDKNDPDIKYSNVKKVSLDEN